MKQGIKPNAWTEAENDLMREHYPTGGAEAVMLYVTRSKKAIRMHAEVLGITTSHGPAPWTPEQEAVVREKYFDLGAQAVGKLIGRTAWGVRKYAEKLGVRGNKARDGMKHQRQLAMAKKQAARRHENLKPLRVVEPAMRIKESPLKGEAINHPAMKFTVCPSGEDMRYRVTSAPSVVDSRECRDWAKEVAA